MKTQCDAILAYLKTGRAVTPLMALERFQSLRLAARVKELRDRGHQIKTRQVAVGRSKRVASYSLAST